MTNEDSLLEKSVAVEERAKASEEKFNKLKNMYGQIRDEHIKLLRQVRYQIPKFHETSTKITSRHLLARRNQQAA